MAKQSTADKARELALSSAETLGVVIWSVEFVKEGASYYLRYYIDKNEGVSIDDCEAFSRMIDPILDEEDFIDESYYLEVSSPGIERLITEDWHFEAYINEDIKVRLIRPKDGKKEFIGTLTAFNDGVITLSCEGEEITLNKSETAWTKSYYNDF